MNPKLTSCTTPPRAHTAGVKFPTVTENNVPKASGPSSVDPSACRTATPPKSLPTSRLFGMKERARELAAGLDPDERVMSVETMMKGISGRFRARMRYRIASHAREIRAVQRSRVAGRRGLTGGDARRGELSDEGRAVASERTLKPDVPASGDAVRGGGMKYGLAKRMQTVRQSGTYCLRSLRKDSRGSNTSMTNPLEKPRSDINGPSLTVSLCHSSHEQ